MWLEFRRVLFRSLGPSTSLQIHQFRFFLWPSNIPLYTCATSSLSIHLLIDTGCYHLLAIVNNSAMKFGVQVSVWVPTFSYFGCIPRGGISGLYSVSMFNLVRNHKLFSTGAAPFYIPTSNVWELQFLNILVSTIYLSYCRLPSRCEMISHCSFDLHFSNDQWCWAFFHVSVGHLYIFFGEMSI